MIKIGEMKVNSNIKPETYLILIIVAIVILCIVLRATILDYICTKDYIKESAIITDKYAEYYETIDHETSRDNYVELDYEYNNQTYHKKQRVFSLFNKKIGNSITVYINPDNPNEIKNVYNTRAFYIIDVLLIVWLIFTIKAYKNTKKSK